MGELSSAAYGKHAIHVVSWTDDDQGTAVRDLTIDVEVHGDFDEAYLAGDNKQILPSDTLRRHVLAQCEAEPCLSIERLLPQIAQRLLRANPATSTVVVSASEERWSAVGQMSFTRQLAPVTCTARVDSAGACSLESGIAGLEYFSISGNSFAGFLRDELTVQTNAVDRPMSGKLDARWQYVSSEPDPAQVDDVRNALIGYFADQKSSSVQDFLTSAAQAMLNEMPILDRIWLTFYATTLCPLPEDISDLKGTATFEVGPGPVGMVRIELGRD